MKKNFIVYRMYRTQAKRNKIISDKKEEQREYQKKKGRKEDFFLLHTLFFIS
jgi:hypothetical protein